MNLNIKKLFNVKIVRYGLIGGVSTAVHVSVAFLYIYFLHDSLFIANTVGFFTAYWFSYTVQSKYVFEHSLSFAKAFKYLVVQFTSLLIAMGVTYYAPLENSYLQTILVVLILPLVTFIVHKFWTFKL